LDDNDDSHTFAFLEFYHISGVKMP